MATQAQKNEKAKEELKPQAAKPAKGDGSGYFPKDEIFNKEKTFINKKTGVEEKIPADWRNLHVGGQAITLHKGVELTKEQSKAFDKDAKSYYLVKK